jgi:hypothetical protein
MNDDHTLTAIRDRLVEARDSLPRERPGIPASEIIARARTRRTGRWVATVVSSCAAIGLALALALPSGSLARAVHVNLASWSVNTNSNGTVTVTVRQLTHGAELQRALAEAGLPAIVTFTQNCLRGTQNLNGRNPIAGVTTSDNPPGLTINPAQIPSGATLVFSVIPVVVHPAHSGGFKSTGFGWGLAKNGQQLHCYPHDQKAAG